MLAINSSTKNLYAGPLTALRMQLRSGQTQALPHEAYIFVLIQHLGPRLPQVFFHVYCPFWSSVRDY